MNPEPFALERFFAAHEFHVAHNLCASDCETLSVGELLALEPGAGEALSALRLGYTETAGDPGLRQEIAGLYRGIAADDVLVFSGAEEAIFVFMNAALRAGDHLVVHSPCYQSLAAVAQAAGCRVTPWLAEETRGWEPDPERLSREIVPATRAVVVNFPHNPTGFLPRAETFAAIADLARRRGLLLFSDEVYRFLEYREADRLPAACEVYENGVSLGVMSKAFGLAGLRLGWVACRNRELLRAMAGLKDYTTICAAAPSEFLAQLALRHHRLILGRNLEIIGLNRRSLDAFFSRRAAHFSWRPPAAGPVAFPAVRFAAESDGFCAGLLREQGVLLLPGSVFGGWQGHFRIGLGRRDLPQALEKLSAYMDLHFG